MNTSLLSRVAAKFAHYSSLIAHCIADHRSLVTGHAFSIIAAFLLLLTTTALASTTSVPMLMTYHGLVTDGQGNFLPNGQATAWIRFSDEDGNVIWQERQTVDVANGAVSILVGNGLEVDRDVPKGGIPPEVFTPGDRRFLEVEVEGEPAYSNMEVVSVPYSYYANDAMHVMEGGVDSDSIKDGAIKAEHLSSDAMQGIIANITASSLPQEVMLQSDIDTTFGSNKGASYVGIGGGFTYSARSTVEGVMRDLDMAIATRQARIDALQTATNTSITNLQTTKLDKTGGTITGDLIVQGTMTVGSGDTAVDMSKHDHTKEGQGASLVHVDGDTFNQGPLFIVSGQVMDVDQKEPSLDTLVTVPSKFVDGECHAISSVFWTQSQEGIDTICTNACWINDAEEHGFYVRCWTDWRREAGTGCDNKLENCQVKDEAQGGPCKASFLIMCAKKYIPKSNP